MSSVRYVCLYVYNVHTCFPVFYYYYFICFIIASCTINSPLLFAVSGYSLLLVNVIGS